MSDENKLVRRAGLTAPAEKVRREDPAEFIDGDPQVAVSFQIGVTDRERIREISKKLRVSMSAALRMAVVEFIRRSDV